MGLRALLVIACLVSAAVHFTLWAFEDFSELEVVGPAFLVNAVAGIVIAVLLVVGRGSWLPLFLAFGFGASTLLAFAISTTPTGLFGVHDSWLGVPQMTATIAETVLVVGSVVAARREGWIGVGPV